MAFFSGGTLGQSHDMRRVADLLESIDEELSLEATVLRERALLLKKESIKLARQRAFLREERRKTREETDAIQLEKVQLERLRSNGWPAVGSFPGVAKDGAPPKTLRFNIGGQAFEASEAVLKKDPGSLLAALCSKDSPMQLQDDGAFYFDRDWWLFRYILIFLRDGMLPDERRLLVQLYREASFWNLESLRRAIEETQLNLGRKTLKLESTGEIKEGELEQGWWMTIPKWLEAEKKEAEKRQGGKKEEGGKEGGGKDEGGKKDKAGGKKAKEEDDWWTGSEYKGRKYTVLSSAPDRVVTDEKEADAMPMLQSTWARPVEKKPKEAAGGHRLYDVGFTSAAVPPSAEVLSAAVPLPRPRVRELPGAGEKP